MPRRGRLGQILKTKLVGVSVKQWYNMQLTWDSTIDGFRTVLSIKNNQLGQTSSGDTGTS